MSDELRGCTQCQGRHAGLHPNALHAQAHASPDSCTESAPGAQIWVTHEDSQPARVGGRIFTLPLGTMVCFASGSTPGLLFLARCV